MNVVFASPFVSGDLQAAYDAGSGEIATAAAKPFVVDGTANGIGDWFTLRHTGVDVLAVNLLGAFVRGPLIADGATSALREVRFTTDNTGNDWTFRPRTSAIPSGPGLIRFRSDITGASDSTLNQLQLYPESQTFGASFDKISTMSGVVLTVDFTPSPGFGAFIGLGATIEFAQTTSLFGAANVVRHAQRYQPQSGAGGIQMGPIFTFVHICTISANGEAGVIHTQTRDFSSQPIYNGDGGTLQVSTQQQFLAAGAVNAGATVITRYGFRFTDTTGAGTTQTQRAVSLETLANGTVENTAIYCNQVAGANNRFIFHAGTSQSDFGGPIAFGDGTTFDIVLSRLIANVLTMADGDSFRITTGSLFMGASGTVQLTVPAANVLQLSTGDGLRFVNGALEHQAGTVGFFGATPVGQSAAYTRNAAIVADRTLLASASATTLNNNNVLAALIADLQAIGILG